MDSVAIYKDSGLAYDCPPPFHPAGDCPECPFPQRSERNSVYDAVRSLLARMGLDAANYGDARWNPLGEFIRPGDRVLIKPNLVHHFAEHGLDCMVTHASVIRAAADYALIALQGRGSLIIGDAPLQTCDFDELVRATGLADTAAFLAASAGLDVRLLDFRAARSRKHAAGYMERLENAPGGDAGEHVAVRLDAASALAPISGRFEQFRVTWYDPREMTRHHNDATHEYLVSRHVLQADVVINLPKLKTHRKAGFTCSLKNSIGINVHKDWLPHHRAGSPAEGGDEYLHPSRRKALERVLAEKRNVARSRLASILFSAARLAVYATRFLLPNRDGYREGSWYGNDTLPRTIADLNRVLLFADRQGVLRDRPQRKLFVLADAVVAGEGEGPLRPQPRRCGLLLAGTNCALLDAVCAELMGFDRARLPALTHALDPEHRLVSPGELDALQIQSEKCAHLADVYDAYGEDFLPAAGWRGHVERSRSQPQPTPEP